MGIYACGEQQISNTKPVICHLILRNSIMSVWHNEPHAKTSKIISPGDSGRRGGLCIPESRKQYDRRYY